MRLSSEHEADYRKFVTRHAQKIVDYSEQHPLSELATIRELDNVDSAFLSTTREETDSDGDHAWFVRRGGGNSSLLI